MANHKKKRSKIWLLILLIFILALILAGMVAGNYVSGKLSNLNIKHIDKEELGINNELYEAVSESLTKSEFNNVKNIVLFGIDTQSKGDGQDEEGFLGRSDTIMIASINPKYKTLKLISIPRDTYVEIEGYR